MNDEIMSAICHCQLLEMLNLASCKDITDDAFLKFISCNYKRLKSLNISWTNISSRALEKVSQCTSLRKLNLSGLKDAANDQTVKDIITECKLLTHLDLSDCANLTSEVFEVICEKGLCLRKLSISNSCPIPASMLKNLSRLVCLSHLDIFGFSNAYALANLQKLVPSLRINQRSYSNASRPVTTSHSGYLWEQRMAFCM